MTSRRTSIGVVAVILLALAITAGVAIDASRDGGSATTTDDSFEPLDQEGAKLLADEATNPAFFLRRGSGQFCAHMVDADRDMCFVDRAPQTPTPLVRGRFLDLQIRRQDVGDVVTGFKFIGAVSRCNDLPCATTTLPG